LLTKKYINIRFRHTLNIFSWYYKHEETDWLVREIKGVVIMPNKNMRKLISALTVLGVIRQESYPTIASSSSYHFENAQVQRIENQRQAQSRNHDNYGS